MIKYFKIGFLILVAVYVVPDIVNPNVDSFLYGVNLIIHEAGHPIFGILGFDFLASLGGTLMQLLVPLSFVLYFLFRKEYYSASVVMLWFAGSLASTVPYIADAVAMDLPLLGGEAVTHDWNYMLKRLGWLNAAGFLSWMAHFFAYVSFGAALGLGFWKSGDKAQV